MIYPIIFLIAVAIAPMSAHARPNEPQKHLSYQTKLDRLLKRQDYAEVINTLALEPSANKRVAWLESKLSERHTMLIFELALQLLKAKPSLKTYYFETLPFFRAAIAMLVLDCSCTSDKSVGGAVGSLAFAYAMQFEEQLERYSQVERDAYEKKHQIETEKVNLYKCKEILNPYTTAAITQMPSPAWVFPHGLGAVLGEENEIPPSQWNTIRQEMAIAYMEEIEEDLFQLENDPEGFLQKISE